MSYSIQFEPLFSLWLLIILALLAGLPVFIGLIMRRGGSIWRLLTFIFFAGAFLNPVIYHKLQKPLKTIVAIIADNSQSQNFGTRKADTQQALISLKQQLKNDPRFELRIIETAKQNNDSNDIANRETHLFAPLQNALADVPPSRIGGVILLTDGQIADIPAVFQHDSATMLNAKLGFHTPVNALISGYPQEYDRRVRFMNAPRFGITNQPLELSFMVEDEGPMPQGNQEATAELFINGKKQEQYKVHPGTEIKTQITLPHVGSNIIELKTAPVTGELTAVNNHTALIIDGVRENLKVLLVSGEPHNGLRTWRDLLKSDTGVDLVHFTILRPPEKADNTPISQLSLIVFPTTELFVNRLKDFDLIIFDRYQHYDVLPLIYYEYMARYVENGGALLVATGPEYAGGRSLALTPLARVLPARPTGNILEKPFLPRLTKDGKRHPVTRNLEGGTEDPPRWGHWLRQIEAKPDSDSIVLMEGASNQAESSDNRKYKHQKSENTAEIKMKREPLMLLADKGQGRVGMLLSDEGWLWARGFEGGGPYAALYRRMAHWLMKEPELEAESLTATAKGHEIFITRRTMLNDEQNQYATGKRGKQEQNADSSLIAPFHITLPSGKTIDIMPHKKAEGLYTAVFTSPETGLVQIVSKPAQEVLSAIEALDKNQVNLADKERRETDNVNKYNKITLVHAGAADIPEFTDIIATPAKLMPLAEATGGHVLRMHKNQKNENSIQIGSIKAVTNAKNIAQTDKDSLILQMSQDTKLLAETRLPLFANIWYLALGLIFLALTWWRESRNSNENRKH